MGRLVGKNSVSAMNAKFAIQDTGWKTLEINEDVFQRVPSMPAQYRRVTLPTGGAMVFLRGQLMATKDTTSNTIAGHIPKDCRPSQTMQFCTPHGAAGRGTLWKRLEVQVSGTLEYIVPEQIKIVKGCWYSVDCCYMLS